MASSKGLLQSIFGRLFSGNQEAQVRVWVRQIADGDAEAQSAKNSLQNLQLDVLPILAKLGKEQEVPLARTAKALYTSMLDAAAEDMFAQPEDLTIGSEKLTPREFLEHYGHEAFKKRYGVTPNSTGGQSLLAYRRRH